MADISMSLDQLVSDSEELQAAANKMDGQLDELRQYVANFLTTYHGQAAAAFTEFSNVLSTSSAAMNADVASASRTLTEMIATMEQSDKTAAAGFQ